MISVDWAELAAEEFLEMEHAIRSGASKGRIAAQYPAFAHLVGIDVALTTLSISSAILYIKAIEHSIVKSKDDINKQLAIDGAQYLKSIAPRDTGSFVNSIYADDAAIYGNVEIATYLNDGTAPHRIEAKNAKALAFVPSGSSFIAFATYVDHPGTHATGIIDKTVEFINKDIEDVAENKL